MLSFYIKSAKWWKNVNSHNSSNTQVENVEVVERNSKQSEFNMLQQPKPSTDGKNINVEDVGTIDSASYFSTLSTRLKNMPVENYSKEKSLTVSDLKSIPRIPRFPYEQKGQLENIFDWLKIAIEEGHIEPSQPCVGKILGWPQFGCYKRSLWSDFILWCKKQGLQQIQIADSPLFYSVLDKIFERKGDHYDFPPIALCQNKYSELRREYESSTTCK